MGLADGRWTRELSRHPSLIPEFAEATRAVHAEALHRSRLSMTTRERLIHKYVRKKHEPELEESCAPHHTGEGMEEAHARHSRQALVRID
ncbi:hypothetical protein ACFWVP_19485 [Streptomyces sp. NPDC058637]|uniref:hypothetical protein n=1 Tax=Streptomyces sp. NPDC058637 TaxID=3346569 RepID=UPI00364E65D3